MTATDDALLEWSQVTSLPGADLGRHHPITIANETHAFLLTGTTQTQTFTADMYMYDEAANTWTPLVDNPFPGTARSFGYGVVLPVASNSKAYIGFGAAPNNELLADFWEFDMGTHEWKRLADFPGPGRRHPAMNVVRVNDRWEIHVGLGDGLEGNFNDWWLYNVASDTWSQTVDFPGSQRHHPFYFGLGSDNYAGLGHSDGFSPYIERDWYRFESSSGQWQREVDFESYSDSSSRVAVTTEARVAGTQFSIQLANRSLGFVLSGDGDDHSTMETGEFHAFDPTTGSWFQLPPHPGPSRWAPGSFVMRGTARAYFTCGYDRSTRTLFDDMWKIDLTPLFESSDTTVSTDKQEDAPTVQPQPENPNMGDELSSGSSFHFVDWFVGASVLLSAHLLGLL